MTEKPFMGQGRYQPDPENEQYREHVMGMTGYQMREHLEAAHGRRIRPSIRTVGVLRAVHLHAHTHAGT